MGSKRHLKILDGVAVKPKRRKAKNKQLKIGNDKVQYSWADLPDQIIEFISAFLYPHELLIFRSVCKDWRRAATQQCLVDPQLVILNRCPQNPPYMISMSQMMWFNINSRLFDFHESCIGSTYGWLIMRHKQSGDLSLLNLFTGSVLRLPPLHHKISVGQVCLSSPPTSPDCTILVIGISFDYSFAFCKLGDIKWTLSRDAWPDIQKVDFLQQVVALQGKFYCISEFGNFVTIVDLIANDVHVSRVEVPYRRPDQRVTCLQFLLEAQGEILLVIVWLSIVRLYDVEVLRMDLSSLKWVKMVSLDNRLLFLGYNCSFCVDAGSMRQPRGNYVYIANHSISGWSKFDMESKSLSDDIQSHWPSTTTESNRFWTLPNFLQAS